jgi:hypothetical protein
MSDCRADGTRKANSPWLIVFLLLAFGFTPLDIGEQNTA